MSRMKPPEKKPVVAPWIPARPAQPVMVSPGRWVHRGPAAEGVLRAGWVFTGIVCICYGVGAALVTGEGGPLADVMEVGGAVLLGLGIYLTYAGCFVILVLSIIAMVRGSVGRGIMLLAGAPVMVFLFGWCGALAGAAVKERRREGAAEVRHEYKPPPVVKQDVDAAASALRVDAIITEAEKMMKVRNEALFQAARSDAFSKASGPDIREEHRAALQDRLRGMFDAAEVHRAARLNLPAR